MQELGTELGAVAGPNRKRWHSPPPEANGTYLTHKRPFPLFAFTPATRKMTYQRGRRRCAGCSAVKPGGTIVAASKPCKGGPSAPAFGGERP
jgi:hypothetical protein